MSDDKRKETNNVSWPCEWVTNSTYDQYTNHTFMSTHLKLLIWFVTHSYVLFTFHVWFICALRSHTKIKFAALQHTALIHEFLKSTRCAIHNDSKPDFSEILYMTQSYVLCIVTQTDPLRLCRTANSKHTALIHEFLKSIRCNIYNNRKADYWEILSVQISCENIFTWRYRATNCKCTDILVSNYTKILVLTEKLSLYTVNQKYRNFCISALIQIFFKSQQAKQALKFASFQNV